MAATAEDIKRWFNDGKKQGATHMIVVCDTFDWDDYPVYVMPGKDVREEEKRFHGNMQQVMEVYSFKRSWKEQSNGGRVFNYD
jgi:hypothetical protein